MALKWWQLKIYHENRTEITSFEEKTHKGPRVSRVRHLERLA